MQEHEGLDGVESAVHQGWCQNQLSNIPPSDLATEDSPILVSFPRLLDLGITTTALRHASATLGSSTCLDQPPVVSSASSAPKLIPQWLGQTGFWEGRKETLVLGRRPWMSFFLLPGAL